MERPIDDMQNCNFCKAVLMLIIVLYHSGMFWTGKWFNAIIPAESAPIIGMIVRWMATFHIYAFTLISGYVYYYVRYERGGYNDSKKFIKNKLNRLIIPYISVAALWVIPMSSLFFDMDATIIIRNYLLGISPSQLWFLLMLFGVFAITYPLSNIFRKHPKVSVLIVAFIWALGRCLARIMPDIFQIYISLQFIPFFYLGFELRRNWGKFVNCNTKNCWLIGGLNLIVNISCFVFIQIIPQISATNKIITTVLTLGVNISGSLMAFFLLLAIARTINWHTKFFNSLSKASYPIYLFHQQIIYVVLYMFNGIMDPLILMMTAFIIATALSWGLSSAIAKIPILRPIIGLKYV